MTVRVQREVFDVTQLIASLQANDPGVGAVVNFVGYVRDINQGKAVTGLFLEHYPGMTERSLQKIIDNARARWPLRAVQVVHRIARCRSASRSCLSASAARIARPLSRPVRSSWTT